MVFPRGASLTVKAACSTAHEALAARSSATGTTTGRIPIHAARLGWWPATRWAFAHESGCKYVTDSKLDWYNNYVGRLLGGHLSSLLVQGLGGAKLLCEGAWNSGYLWYQNVLTETIYWSGGRLVPTPNSGPNRP